MESSAWPVTLDDVRAAEARLRPFLPATPLRRYPVLETLVGDGLQIFVKHENFQPTGAFKVRNGLAALTAMPEENKRRGVVAATRGNHGLGLAWAGQKLGVAVTLCVPKGNNPEKNEAARGFGAVLVEEGRDYDEAVAVAARLVDEHGLSLVHSTNEPAVIAGSGTITLEMLEQEPGLEALVFAVGGGSQAVGGLVVARALAPAIEVYAVQAAGASAIHDSWHAGRPMPGERADTFADGLATRGVYALTFPALREGLRGFVKVSDAAIAEAFRMILRTTHTLVEGAGAAGLAGVIALKAKLRGRRVGIVLSGANADRETISRVVGGSI